MRQMGLLILFTLLVKWLSIVSGALLLLAILPIWPDAYYELLRWIIFTSTIIVAWRRSHGIRPTIGLLLFGAIALLFNPIAPVHLNKFIWVVIYLISAIIFFSTIDYLEKEHVYRDLTTYLKKLRRT